MDPISAYGVLMLVAGLQLKHMICDGPGQSRWMIANKSTYGAVGGLTHGGAHLAGSLIVLAVLSIPMWWALLLAVADGVIHYHVDFAKEQLVKVRRLTTVDRLFWWVLAVDQAIHHMTYVLMVAVLIAWSN